MVHVTLISFIQFSPFVNPVKRFLLSIWKTYPGGKGLNQAVALAKAGSVVYFAGCIGVDGEFLKEVLTTAGVNIKHLKTIEEKTGHAIIQVDKAAENSIIIYAWANGCITKDHIDAVLKDFATGDILVIQNEINNLPYLIHQAGELGMQIYFNPSPINDQLKKIDLRVWLYDRNPVADYLAKNTVSHMIERKKVGPIWSKPLWDVTAVVWLLNDADRFMRCFEIPVRLPDYNGQYGTPQQKSIKYVYAINRDALFADLVRCLTE